MPPSDAEQGSLAGKKLFAENVKHLIQLGRGRSPQRPPFQVGQQLYYTLDLPPHPTTGAPSREEKRATGRSAEKSRARREGEPEGRGAQLCSRRAVERRSLLGDNETLAAASEGDLPLLVHVWFHFHEKLDLSPQNSLVCLL